MEQDQGDFFLLTIPRRLTEVRPVSRFSVRKVPTANINTLGRDLKAPGKIKTSSHTLTMEVPADGLRARILDLRQTNYDLRPFVPQDDLYSLLTLPVVSSTLEYNGVDKGRLGDLAQIVHQGARKVFAVLVILNQVQHISVLVGHDQFQDLDQQLPFDSDKIKRKGISASMASDFYDQQWQFLAPVFSKTLLPRELVDLTPLPIIERDKIGSGSFGTVYKIRIHTSHHNLDKSVEQWVWLPYLLFRRGLCSHGNSLSRRVSA